MSATRRAIVVLAAFAAFHGVGSGADPVPIQRVIAPPPANSGPLRALPREEFDAKVQAVAEALQAGPRIVEARYSAKLSGTDLTGNGTWRVTAAAPAVLPLLPLNVALANPRFGDKPATLDHTVTATRLWLETGESSCAFDWSAQGREEPGAIRFDLQWPAPAVAVLELDLPSDRDVVAPESLVTGPLASDVAQHSRWRIAFGGKPRHELVIRRAATGIADAALARRTAHYDLIAGLATAQFEFELESLRGPATIWAFRVDPDVRVLDVITPRGDPWHFDAARREIVVTLREPQPNGKVTVSTAMAYPLVAANWSCPGVHAIAAPGEDTLEFRVTADVRLDRWEPGDYTLHRTAPSADRGYVMVFRGSWRTGDLQRKPPVLSLRASPPRANVSAALNWQPGESTNRLNAKLHVVVLNGPVASLALRLPSGYSPGPANLSPEDPAAGVTVNAAGVWTLEPSRAWNTGQTVDVQFDLRGPPPLFKDDRAVLALPKLTPIGAVTYEGTLGVAPGPSFRTVQNDGLLTLERITVRAAAPAPRRVVAKSDWQFEYPTLEARLDSAGRITATLRGLARTAPDRWLPIDLPAGAVVESAAVAGLWVDPAVDGSFVRLPWPAVDNISFEVQFRMPEPVTGWTARTPDLSVRLPGDPAVSVLWACSDAHRCWPSLGSLGTGESILVVHRGALALALGLVGLLIVTVLLLVRRWLGRIALTFAAFALVLAAAAVFAADPPVSVYIHDGTAYAPAMLLDRLDSLAAGDRPPFAITAADLHGVDEGTHASFDVKLCVVLTTDAEIAVPLPVVGLVLEAVTLDGQPAFPEARAGQRYALTLSGVGEHTIILRGRIPVVHRGVDREVTLPLDPLPSAKLNFRLPPGSRGVSVPTRQGRLTLSPPFKYRRVTADLGSVSAVVVRWRVGTGPADPARVIATALTLWDVAPVETTVTAAYALQVDEGFLNRLTFELPANLEPGRLTVRAANGATSGVRDWRIADTPNGPRTFTVLLQEPLETAGTVVLHLVPTAALPMNPTFGAVKLLTASSVPTRYLAVRCAAPVDRWERVAARDAPPDELPRELLALLVPERNPTPLLVRLDGTDGGTLRAVVRPAALPRPVAEDLAWRFGDKAAVAGLSRFPRDHAVSAVELDVPAAVAVPDFQAPDLAGWSRQGGRVTLWFRSPQRDLVIAWTGTWNTYPKAPAFFDLPQPPRPAPWRIVKLLPADGVTLTVPPARGWRPTMTLAPSVQAFLAPGINVPLRVETARGP